MIVKAPRLSQIYKSKSFNPKSPSCRPSQYRNIRSALTCHTQSRSENRYFINSPRSCRAFANWPTNQNRRMLFVLRLPFIVTSAHLRSSRMITLWNAELSSKSPYKTCFGVSADWSPKMIWGENASVFQPPTSWQQLKVKPPNISHSSWSVQKIGMIV